MGNHVTSPVCIRRSSRDWKLIEVYETGASELFDLRRDLAEQHNLAASQTDRVKAMKTVLNKWQNKVEARQPIPNPNYDPQRATELGKSSNGKRKGRNE